MRLHIERARTKRPVSWLTLIGVLLLPVVIGGLLVVALFNPAARLDNMSAAIVNDDVPVTVQGQLAPLGRQLTAGLVKGSDQLESNLDWTITNADDAESGLADGTYQAVITIPKDFSAAATSTAGAHPTQATISVATAPDAKVIDGAITAQVTQAAASLMGQQLSQIYLQNVFLGFTTLGDKLGSAADGADELSGGASQAATGVHSLADGVQALSGGASGLATGADGIASGVGSLSGGLSTWAQGAGTWAQGATSWSQGARQAADGLTSWADGARQTADGTAQLADGLNQMADQVSQIPAVPQEVIDGITQLAANSDQIKTGISDAASQLADLSAQCVAEGGSQQLCDAVAKISAGVDQSLPQINEVLEGSGQIADQVAGLAQFGPQLTAGLRQSADGATALAQAGDKLADGAADSAAGVGSLADGAQSMADGAQGLASGASQLAGGATQASAGAAQWADGADTWADGAASAADGASSAADGVTKLADGTSSLASGLHTATDAIPTYTDEQAKDLAGVVSDPVVAAGVSTSLFGAGAIPLLAIVALWFGGLASFVALRAVSQRTLASRRPSALLALRALSPAAVIGAAQGLLVAGIVQVAASYDWGTWSLFALVCVVAGVTFAAVNQALVAVFGGAGRWIAALVGVLAVAAGVISTVPAILIDLAGVMPTAPALSAGLAALTGAGGLGAGIVGMLIWAVLAFAATVLAVMRRRTMSLQALREPLRLAA